VTPLRVVQEPAKSGATLMEEDRHLLERAERGEVGTIVRFYEWDTPTISLGYHQSEDQLDMDCLTAAHMLWVRRPTGGAAVLHSEELTYALVLSNCEGPRAAARVQELISRAIAGGLRALGVAADVDERGEPLSALPNRVSCFVRTSRWEVTVKGRKIVGSAQRKLPGAILQHGSILTGNDHLRITDFLRMKDEESRILLRERLEKKATSIRNELGHSVPIGDVRNAMAESFTAIFSRPLQGTVGDALDAAWEQ
jgi:lipoate-protein ligase A